MSISVILTVHNEGGELQRTLDSIQSSTQNLHEIIIVDDASTDGCCNGMESRFVRVIRHEERIGVAYSRNEGAELATGKTLAFLDGHQRLSQNCLDICSQLAHKKNGIVSPGIKGFNKNNKLIYGASFRLCPEKGFFSAKWDIKYPWKRARKLTALRAPGYSIPKHLYHKLKWVDGMKSWGGSEALLSMKSFFTNIPIIYLRGPVAYHMFKEQFNYDVNWDSIWMNHALITRICFGNDSWENYWLPSVFQDHLSEEGIKFLDSKAIRDQHDEFQKYKLRSDADFWRILLKQTSPESLFASV